MSPDLLPHSRQDLEADRGYKYNTIIYLKGAVLGNVFGGVCVFELFYVLHLKAPPLWDWVGGGSWNIRLDFHIM